MISKTNSKLLQFEIWNYCDPVLFGVFFILKLSCYSATSAQNLISSVERTRTRVHRSFSQKTTQFNFQIKKKKK